MAELGSGSIGPVLLCDGATGEDEYFLYTDLSFSTYLHHLGFFLQPAVTQWLAHGLGLGAEPASTELMSVRDLLDAR